MRSIVLIWLSAALQNLINVNCVQYMVTVPAHTEFSYEQDRYAEGTFHKYIFADTSSLIVHDGHNVQRPFSSNYTSKDTIKLFDNEVIRYSGKSDGFFFIEDFYSKSGITIRISFKSVKSPLINGLNQVSIKKKSSVDDE